MTTTALTLGWRVGGHTRWDTPAPGGPAVLPQGHTGGRSLSERYHQEVISSVADLGRPMSVSGVAAVHDEVLGVALLAALPEGYALSHPVHLVVHRSELSLWVTSETGFLHGTGRTRDEAIEDYACALVDYLELLREERAILVPHLLDHLKQLEQLIS